MTHHNVRLVRRFYEGVINRGDLDIFDALVADGFVDHAAHPMYVPGKDGSRTTYRQLLQQFPDLQAAILAITAAGDTVAVRVRMSGTRSGRIGPFGPNRKPVLIDRAVWWRVEDDLLAERWAVEEQMCEGSAITGRGAAH